MSLTGGSVNMSYDASTGTLTVSETNNDNGDAMVNPHVTGVYLYYL